MSRTSKLGTQTIWEFIVGYLDENGNPHELSGTDLYSDAKQRFERIRRLVKIDPLWKGCVPYIDVTKQKAQS